jgi:hypothetical protein
VGQLAFAQLELGLCSVRENTLHSDSVHPQKASPNSIQPANNTAKPVNFFSLSLRAIHACRVFPRRFGFVFVKTLSTFIQNEKKKMQKIDPMLSRDENGLDMEPGRAADLRTETQRAGG